MKHRSRWIPIVMVILTVAVVAQYLALIVLPIHSKLQVLHAGLNETLGEAIQQFSSHWKLMINPLFGLLAYPASATIVVLVAVAVWVAWVVTRRKQGTRKLPWSFISLSALPLLAALSLGCRNFVTITRRLAEVGNSDPFAIGISWAAALAIVTPGLCLSGVLAVGGMSFRLFAHRPEPGPGELEG